MTVPVPTGMRMVRVWIYRRTVATRTTLRDISTLTWTKLANRWGQVKIAAMPEAELAAQVVGPRRTEVIIPYVSGLTTADAVVLGGADPGGTTSEPTFGIESIDDRDYAHVEHVLTLKSYT